MNFISNGVKPLILLLCAVKIIFKVQHENRGAIGAAVRDGNRRCATSQEVGGGTQQVRGVLGGTEQVRWVSE